MDYPENSFDVITSMDTMYFAKDMILFVAQIKRWLKPDGIYFVGYQEAEVMPKTENADITVLADALKANDMRYEVVDITKQTYDLLMHKRNAALRHKQEFESEGNLDWFDMLMRQTECATVPYEKFADKMARYIYVARI